MTRTLYRWIQILGISVVLLGAISLIIKKPLNLGLDLQGGMRLILEAQETSARTLDDDAMNGIITVLKERIDGLGITEPVIRRKGSRQVVVELAGIDDPARARAMIGQTALLRFVAAQWAPAGASEMAADQIQLLAGDDARFVLYKDGGYTRGLFLKDTVMTGEQLKWAQPTTDQYGKMGVDIAFTSEGAAVFYAVTQRLTGQPLAILLDDIIISAPTIREPIAGGKAVISGDFDLTEMRDLVVQLKAGALPVPVEVVSETVVGPTLGIQSLAQSKQAAIIGFGLLVVFMIITYRLSGCVAVVALLIYGLLVLACLSALNATLTLPGIAGFILTIGMAVDANVIIFERIKEELSQGRSFLAAVKSGFSQATVTILDANVTTLLSAAVLFWLGTGVIKGFAITLTVGILVSMITALVVTQLMLSACANRFSDYSQWFFGKQV
ncbi:protein translocase subunit SecD [bacterium]|nr:protein translocase subunit SecD [bacterium]|tara:strand:- start:4992 stop:6314 length:1323 start_codon:yes stop_codon:yes gene_type:complete